MGLVRDDVESCRRKRTVSWSWNRGPSGRGWADGAGRGPVDYLNSDGRVHWLCSCRAEECFMAPIDIRYPMLAGGGGGEAARHHVNPSGKVMDRNTQSIVSTAAEVRQDYAYQRPWRWPTQTNATFNYLLELGPSMWVWWGTRVLLATSCNHVCQMWESSDWAVAQKRVVFNRFSGSVGKRCGLPKRYWSDRISHNCFRWNLSDRNHIISETTAPLTLQAQIGRICKKTTANAAAWQLYDIFNGDLNLSFESLLFATFVAQFSPLQDRGATCRGLSCRGHPRYSRCFCVWSRLQWFLFGVWGLHSTEPRNDDDLINVAWSYAQTQAMESM